MIGFVRPKGTADLEERTGKNAELKEQIEKMKTIIEKKYCKKCLYRKDNELFLKLANDENEQLKAQIEKMKCCQNCADGKSCEKSGLVYVCDKWRFENERRKNQK